ncbi:MFS transporter [Streptomyces sp. NPDC050560]|uniref:MFS transporter n=1 Tax=Streptomyces sp. NPDC050560 TaxID=3365630 RepID=UPI0037A554F7
MPPRARLLLLALGMFALGTDGYVIAGLLPAIATDLGVSVSAAGQLVIVFSLSYAIGAPVLGVATAGLPRRPVLVASLAVFALANFAAAAVGSYAGLLLLRVLAALAAGTFAPAAAAAAASLASPERRGRALALVGGGITVANAVGVPIGLIIGGTLGWRATFLTVAVIGAVAAIGLTVLLPAIHAPRPPGLRDRLAVVRLRGMPRGMLLSGLWIAGAFALLTYISPVLDAVGRVHGSALSIWLFVFGLAATAGNSLGGRAADRHPARWLTAISTGGLMCVLAGFGLLATLHVPAVTGAVAAAVLLGAWGVFGWSFAPIQQNCLIAIRPERAGIILSLNTSAVYLGMSLGGLIGSAALSSSGPAAVGWTAAAIESLALLAALTGARSRQTADAHLTQDAPLAERLKEG